MRFTPRPEAWAPALGALAIAALLAYPLRHAEPLLDDFVFMALARHIDVPWALLAQDALGAYFFRPLVMFAWWVTVALLGTDAAPHYVLGIVLHTANGLLVLALLRRYRIAFAPAAAAALVFAIHPTTFAAASWLSDRFDLFATAFGLVMLIAIDRYAASPSRGAWLAAVAAAFACVASKEIGFAFVAVAIVAIAWPSGDPAASRRQRAVLMGAIAASAVAMLVWRGAALRAAPEGRFLADGLLATFAGGAWNWLARLPDFLVVRHGHGLAEAAWMAALAACIALPFVPPVWRELRRPELVRCGALGLALMALAAAAQAPITNVAAPVPFNGGPFEFSSLASSRLYYVPVAGFALVLAALLEAGRRVPVLHARAALAILVGLAATAGLLASSRAIGREWSTYTRERSGIYVRAAADAVLASNAKPGCFIYLLGTPDHARHFRDVVDTAVKRALPRGHPAASCFLQAEHAPWNHLVAQPRGGNVSPAPLEVIRVAGKPFEPLQVANLTQYYLMIPPTDAVIDDPRASFFSYEGGRFVDVTSRVRERSLKVRFYDDRPQS